MDRKIISLILILCLVLSCFSACGREEEEEEDGSFEPTMAVMLVIDEDGFGDHSYNDLCWEGCERARDELYVDISYTRAGDMEHYGDAIETAVNSEVDLIICAEPAMKDVLKEEAAKYPAQAFAIIDVSEELGDNVSSLSFNAEEGSFLAGIIAALSSKNHVVSFIGGKESEAQYKYLYGFEAGVATANKDTQIGVGWVNSYTDVAEAKKIAVAHGALFSDIIYQSAGNAGKGVVDAGIERGFRVICTGQDGSYLSEETVFFSVVKCADVAVYDAISSYINGDFFERGNIAYSLANGGVAISDPNGNIDEAVMAAAEEYKNRIANGSLQIPYNWMSWYNYVNSL